MPDWEPIHGGSRQPERFSGLTPERLGWLIRLRWIALLGIVLAAVLAALGAFPGVNYQVLFATAAGAAFYNATMWRDLRRGIAITGQRAATYQALIDFLLLTIVLWAAGGLDSPFISYYVFHVALVGILAGPRATLLAGGFALACAGALWITEVVPALRIGVWRPAGFWAPLSQVVAFVSSVGAVAYLVTHAVGELRDRERALEEARDRAELEYEVLSRTLNELDAGLEVLDAKNQVVWRNRLARRLVPRLETGDPWHCPGSERACERDASGVCPIERSFQHNEAGRCRFAVHGDEGGERVYELLSFPLSADPGEKPRVMNLYIDRTAQTLAERQLVLAERLASLGRVAQGVAHELNTPLATIRTLAADMVLALQSIETATAAQRGELVSDLSESASLIREETARLGRIAQALLAGGDLVRLRIMGAVPLGAVVERSIALVFAGVRGGPTVEADPSLDAVRVRCDQDRLVQVLVNLLQNAHDALRGNCGGRIRVFAQLEAENAVCIAVEDNGSGIAKDVRGRLFEPFTTTKPPGEGTGLGLYTSYMLVRAMHGTLQLEPRQSGGTRALLRLPLDTSAAQTHALEPHRALS